MFGSLLCKSGGTLRRTIGIINGESSSSSLAAKYCFFTLQNQNVVISKSRVTSIFYSFSTTTSSNLTSSDSDSSTYVVSYLINSCGLSESEAITVSKKVNFKTTTKPDAVLTLLKTHGFTQLHISKLIDKHPSILSMKPDKSLKPRFDFLKSKGICEPDLASFISRFPILITRGLKKEIIPSFDFLKSIVQSDQNVIRMIKRNSWILCTNQVKRVTVNLEHLKNEGVPETNISKYLIRQSRVFTGDADKFRKIVEKVKRVGFDPFKTTFLVAVEVLSSMSEASWRTKMDVYKRWGWSEDQIQTAFRKHPMCMKVSEKKLMAIMDFLVNEMDYESLSIAKCPEVIDCSLKERIIPRCSVIRILVSRGLIKEKIRINILSKMVDASFLEKFVIKYEQEVPELMKVFQGNSNYQQLLQN